MSDNNKSDKKEQDSYQITSKDYLSLQIKEYFFALYDKEDDRDKRSDVLNAYRAFEKSVHTDFSYDEAINLLGNKSYIDNLINSERVVSDGRITTKISVGISIANQHLEDLKNEARTAKSDADRFFKLGLYANIAFFVASNLLAPISNIFVLKAVHKHTTWDETPISNQQGPDSKPLGFTINHINNFIYVCPHHQTTAPDKENTVPLRPDYQLPPAILSKRKEGVLAPAPR